MIGTIDCRGLAPGRWILACVIQGALIVAAVLLASCSTSPPPRLAVALSTPGQLTLVDEKALYATEALANRIAAAGKVAAPLLPEPIRVDAADRLEAIYGLLLDARCLHRAANGRPHPPGTAARCRQAYEVHGSDWRPVVEQARALAGPLALLFGVK